jgi:alkane 1-monooxygenase
MSATAEFHDLSPRARIWRDTKRFMWPAALFVPVLPYVGYGVAAHSGQNIFWYLAPAIVFILIPVIDGIVGDDGGNPPEELVAQLQQDRYYRWMTFLYLPLQYGGVVLGAWQFVQPGQTWFARVGIVLSVGTVNGIAINTAHELGHKRERLERWLSKIALAPSFYGHFYVEHNRGHHTRVATPEDPASARLGESFYKFWPRTVWGSLHSAVTLEWKRLSRNGGNPWTLKNDVLNAWLMTVVLWGLIIGFFGWKTIPFLILQAVVGFSLLEVVNYLEHYGLKRQLNAAGRYEKVNPLHSWNSNRLATNLFLYELQRHSDHHANPTRRYQVLRHFDESPQLPAGYARMIVIALAPPLWRRTMDPRVVAHYDGDVAMANIDPARRERILAQYSA